MSSDLKSFLAGITLFKKLIMNEIIKDKYWDSKSNRVKYIVRTLISPCSTFKVLVFLSEVPDAKILLERQPSLPFKIHRPYLKLNMSTQEKVRSICGGNRLIYEKLSRLTYFNIYKEKGLSLAKIQGKSDCYAIYLGMENKFSREGELALHFSNNDGVILSSCSFGFIFVDSTPCLVIGAIQGGSDKCTAELIKNATKSCYGLFPKRLLIECLYIISKRFLCDKILSVSNETHIFQSSRYKNKKEKLMFSNYDSFLEGLSGKKNNDNDYELPKVLTRKKISDIPSKKRSEYRKRYELLENLEIDIVNTLD